MNTDQSKYIRSLDYTFTPANLQLSRLEGQSLKDNLAKAETVQDIIEAIKSVNCFGLKDSLIVELLGGFLTSSR